MAAPKLKTEVQINDRNEADLDLELSAEQAVALLDFLVTGMTVRINLMTPAAAPNRENPQAYAS